MKRTCLSMLIVVVMTLVTSIAIADDRSGMYIGAGIGQSAVQIADQDPTFGDFDIDSDDTAWKAFLGWRPIALIAIEGGYRDFGAPKDSAGPLSSKTDLEAFDASVLGIIPIGPVDIYGRVGQIWWDATLDNSDGILASEIEYDGEDLIYGGGVGFFIGQFGVRGEYEVVDANEFSDLEMWNLNVVLSF